MLFYSKQVLPVFPEQRKKNPINLCFSNQFSRNMITYPHLTQIKFEPLGDLTLMILEPWPEDYRKARCV